MSDIPREPHVPTLSIQQIKELESLVFISHKEQKSDVFLIFGSQQGNWEKYARYILKNPDMIVVVTGYKGLETPSHKVPLADYICSQLYAYGVPEKRLIKQSKSTNTLEDALFTKKLLTEQGISAESITFSCLAHHAGRCLLTLKKYFPDMAFRALVSDYYSGSHYIGKNNWWKHAAGRGRVVGECLRIKKYSQIGDIAEPAKMPKIIKNDSLITNNT